MSTVTLRLGDFEFAGVEIPQSIPIKGKQNLAIHELVGGRRVIDAMGAFTEALAWSGWFLGGSALARGRQLDQLRVDGRQLVLTWDQLRFLVVIRDVTLNYQRPYEIPYSITCEVVEDQSQVSPPSTAVPVDVSIAGDTSTAAGLVAQLQAGPPLSAGNTNLSTLGQVFGSVQSAIKAVSSVAQATRSQLNAILQPLAAMRQQVQALTASVNNTLANVTTLGGVLPSNPVSRQVAALGAQLAATQQHPLLVQLDRVTGRIGTNVTASYTTSKQVTVAGGNLFELAARQYGDASAWTSIAKANGLSDPQLTGIQTLTVPPIADKTGGVLEY